MPDEFESDILKVKYPGNTQKDKAKRRAEKAAAIEEKVEEKKVEPIVEGKVVLRKRGLGRKISEMFTGDDARSVMGYVVYDIAIPALKSMLADMIGNGAERALFGEVRSRSYSDRHRRVGYTNYSSEYRRDRDEPRREISSRARRTHDFGGVVLESRGEAEEILEKMADLIAQYKFASVNDLLDLLDQPTDFTGEKWGWTSIRDAGVRRVRDGFLLDLPRTEPVD